MKNDRLVILDTAFELAFAVALPKAHLIHNESALENHLHSMHYLRAANAVPRSDILFMIETNK